ncbi:MAG: hypothetical protein M1823_002821 [Watsoniomyces obsoletus]|nr:MAG: hypothetical protein M1823_002821 [Watsoniomyces obsoletus]
MKLFTLVGLLSLAFLEAAVYAKPAPPPDCLVRCWENSKYMSGCAAQTVKCLCSDETYVNGVRICIDSQCPRAQAYRAMNHLMGICPDEDSDAFARQQSSGDSETATPTATLSAVYRRQPTPRARVTTVNAPARVAAVPTPSVFHRVVRRQARGSQGPNDDKDKDDDNDDGDNNNDEDGDGGDDDETSNVDEHPGVEDDDNDEEGDEEGGDDNTEEDNNTNGGDEEDDDDDEGTSTY